MSIHFVIGHCKICHFTGNLIDHTCISKVAAISKDNKKECTKHCIYIGKILIHDCTINSHCLNCAHNNISKCKLKCYIICN